MQPVGDLKLFIESLKKFRCGWACLNTPSEKYHFNWRNVRDFFLFLSELVKILQIKEIHSFTNIYPVKIFGTSDSRDFCFFAIFFILIFSLFLFSFFSFFSSDN